MCLKALFLALKGLLVGVFSAPKVHAPKNQVFQSKLEPLLTSERVVFGYFGDQKSRFLDFFVLVFFMKFLGIFFN